MGAIFVAEEVPVLGEHFAGGLFEPEAEGDDHGGEDGTGAEVFEGVD